MATDGSTSRSASPRSSSEGAFPRSPREEEEDDEKEALKWAAHEKLPSLGLQERQRLIDKLVKVTDVDNEKFMLKLRYRFDRVGIELPKVEVRYEHLNIEAEAFLASKALPTFTSFFTNIIEAFFNSIHILTTKKKHLTILKDVSGIIKPGRMTLLLGPPSSGKTTLLLALAGQLDSSLKVSGRVTYNGHDMNEFVPQRTAAYISQHDVHIGEMTVRETLAFSARCQGVGSRYDMLTELARREKEAGIKPDLFIDVFMKAAATEGQEANVLTDYYLKVLGLDVCADTLVGDEMVRGISGGQKKRLTTGEIMVGPALALFMDEISNGLDSSTTFHIVNSLRQNIHILNGTAVISLLQPAPETYDLFDDIILLSDGQIVYQGPCELVLDFFKSMGFKCPERKGVADFLQEVTSRKDQRQYWVHREMPYRFITVQEFSEAFQSFHVGQKLTDELRTPLDKSKSHPAALTTKGYGVGMKELFKANISREFLLIKRNSFVYIFKLIQLSTMALVSSTLFFRANMNKDSVSDGGIYIGAMFFAVIMTTFNGMSDISMTVAKLPIFYKQRGLRFYPAWAYALPAWILKIPISFLEVSIWVFLTYYAIGFDPNIGRLFKQLLLLLFINQMASALFRFIAAAGRNMIVAMSFGSFALVVFFAFGGFVLSQDDINNGWIWGYWCSPMMYAQNAIVANEFFGHSWRKFTTNSTESLGVQVLKSRGFFPHAFWYWIGLGAMIGFVLLFNIGFTLSPTFLNQFEKPQAVILEDSESNDLDNRIGGTVQLSTYRSNSSHSANSGVVMATQPKKRGMVLPFEPYSLTFDEVTYSADMPKEMKLKGVHDDKLVLLNGVSGAFRPGVLTALMGVSGAGKTTLMDVLAGRKTGGYITGNITISGYPKKQETFTRISGYCEQNDIHSPLVTVYESLLYSAWLRLRTEVDSETRKMFIEEIMELVELKPLRQSLVGLPGESGLSTEQRKRLTIAVELVANPSIIFMDEPTSGLDARAAAIVMRTVKNTVETGRTVVCTIHQPSIDIFEAFDELFLMKRGGQEIYVGPLGSNSSDLISYLQAIPGVEKIKDGYNPATWMLEVTSTTKELALGIDFTNIYKHSDLYRRNKALIEELSKPAPDSQDIYFPTRYSRSFFMQFLACLWKRHWSYWRNPPYNAVRFLFTTAIALTFGTMFWDMGTKTKQNQDLFNAMGSMYTAVFFIGAQLCSSVQPVVAVERTVYYREKGAGMYSGMSYAFAQVMIEIPYVLVLSVVYGVIVYAMIGFEWTAAKFFWYLFFMFFSLLYFTFYGMMTVAMTPNHNIAAIVSILFFGLWNVFSGFVIPRPGFLNSLQILPTKKKHLTILNDVSGIIKPGRMTLLLGPPCSGKTTLLLALAGKLDSKLKFSGRVTYNGHGMDEFVPQRTAAYISQHDVHIGEMTVRETLAFSARCQGVGSRYDMLTELARREKEAGIKPDPDIDVYMKAAATEGQEANVLTDYYLKVLGLEVCADTLVGDEMVRGISGGQKKRVTTGEMMVGPALALFMDEISTGLDSSTTFQIVNSIRQNIHILNGTAVISLLQPAPETYDLFDDIILLSDAQIVYQGPRELVLDFFESMGFKCPERKGVADFLQEVTSRKDQQQYWVYKEMPYRFVTAQEFSEAFQSFTVGQKLADELRTPFDKCKSHPAALTTKKYGVGKKELLKANISRELLLMKRNSFVYIFKLTQLSSMALVSMTLFFRTKMHKDSVSDGGIYVGATFFAVMMTMFNGMSDISMTIAKLPVFYKQRDLRFYAAWAYALPAWILKIPISFLEVAVWVFLTYYVIGFDPNIGRLFKQFLLLLLVNQMASALFRFIAAAGRNMIVAMSFGSFVLLVLFAFGGFVLSRDDIKKWWVWGYWCSPMMYAQNAIVANEFFGHSWRKFTSNSNETLGVQVLKSRGFFPHAYWYWLGLGATIGFVLLFNIGFTLSLTFLNQFEKPRAVISDESESNDLGNRIGGTAQLSTHGSNSSHKTCSESEDITVKDSFSQLLSQREVTVGAIQPKKRGMVLPFEPHSLTFDEVTYSVDMPKEMKLQGILEDKLMLLNGVSGAFRPGVLTALMGVSGAGKTTLMDVLAGRKTGGYITGNITISGYPKKQETFTRISGYCEQNDIHSPFVTVYESLLYSAWLRLPPEVDSETQKMFIEEIMELVELNPLRQSLVGLPGESGLSTEQRKRLTIAVELVANPSIIFMDEPTSGLDARAAAIVMRTVRNTVDTGRTVVCTIHQPSIDIFESFDELFLMKRGGQEIYVGPLGRHSCHLIRYFEGIPGVEIIKDGYNPATWMLEVTAKSQELTLEIDFTDIYKGSELYRRNKALIEELSRPAPGSKDLYFPTHYTQSFFMQCVACLWKQHWSYWRNPPYTAVRFLFTTVIALTFGTMFWDMGTKMKRNQDLFNAMGSMYTAVFFLGAQYCSSVQPVVAVERAVFCREKGAGMYSAMPYAFAQVMIEIPYIFVLSAVYGIIVYAMIGFEWIAAKFFWYLFFMFFSLLYFTFYGMMTVAMTPNHHIAAIVSILFYGLWNVFSGFVIPRTRIPLWWRWYYWANPVAWTMYGLVASQFGDVEDKMESGETVKQFVRSYFDFKHDFLGVVAVVVAAFAVLFGVLFAVGIKRFNFQNR